MCIRDSSYTMLTERLRGELGFTGVICTDSLSMQAIRDQDVYKRQR